MSRWKTKPHNVVERKNLNSLIREEKTRNQIFLIKKSLMNNDKEMKPKN